MAAATFDTLKFANTLKAAGVPEKQAEAQAAAFAEVIQLNFKDLVTKDDLAAAVKELKRDASDIRDELQRDVADLKQQLRQEIKDESFKLQTQITRLQGESILIRWMLGATLSIVLAIGIRLFFFTRIP